jgi:hypothetical protein
LTDEVRGYHNFYGDPAGRQHIEIRFTQTRRVKVVFLAWPYVDRS